MKNILKLAQKYNQNLSAENLKKVQATLNEIHKMIGSISGGLNRYPQDFELDLGKLWSVPQLAVDGLIGPKTLGLPKYYADISTKLEPALSKLNDTQKKHIYPLRIALARMKRGHQELQSKNYESALNTFFKAKEAFEKFVKNPIPY